MGLCWAGDWDCAGFLGENVHIKTHKHTAHIRFTHAPKKQHMNNPLKYAHMH